MLTRGFRWVFEANPAGGSRRPRAIAGAMTVSYAPLALAALLVAGGPATPAVVGGVAVMLLLPGVLGVLLISRLLRVLRAATAGLQRFVSVPLHEHRLAVSFLAFLLITISGGVAAIAAGALVDEDTGLWGIGVLMAGVITSFTAATLGVSVAVIGAFRPASFLKPDYS